MTCHCLLCVVGIECWLWVICCCLLFVVRIWGSVVGRARWLVVACWFVAGRLLLVGFCCMFFF